MMRAVSPSPVRRLRRGYTLLEMILALSIFLIILSAVYYTMSLHLTSAQAGRELVQDGTLARAVLTRIAHDVVHNLGPVDPKVLPDGSSSSSESPTTTTQPTTTTPSTTTSTPSSGTPTANTTPAESAGDSVNFNLGVLGQANQIVLYVNRVPREMNMSGNPTQSAKGFASGLRRIAYWVTEKGLYRQDITMVTGVDIDTLPPDGVQGVLIAPEVKKLEFEFFDGTDWWPDWDGSVNDITADLSSGDVPRGPPAAVAVTITIERPNAEGGVTSRSYRQVIAIPAGNNFPQPAN